VKPAPRALSQSLSLAHSFNIRSLTHSLDTHRRQTTADETRVVEPAALQEAVDALVAQVPAAAARGRV
jgi:hypothetical protein